MRVIILSLTFMLASTAFASSLDQAIDDFVSSIEEKEQMANLNNQEPQPEPAALTMGTIAMAVACAEDVRGIRYGAPKSCIVLGDYLEAEGQDYSVLGILQSALRKPEVTHSERGRIKRAVKSVIKTNYVMSAVKLRER